MAESILQSILRFGEYLLYGLAVAAAGFFALAAAGVLLGFHRIYTDPLGREIDERTKTYLKRESERYQGDISDKPVSIYRPEYRHISAGIGGSNIPV